MVNKTRMYTADELAKSLVPVRCPNYGIQKKSLPRGHVKLALLCFSTPPPVNSMKAQLYGYRTVKMRKGGLTFFSLKEFSVFLPIGNSKPLVALTASLGEV